MIVLCPYCGQQAKLVDSETVYGPGRSYGMIWDCRPCDAYVGTHRQSPVHAPLGILANAELRGWRQRAHGRFDPLWKSGRTTRTQAYHWLAREIHLPLHRCHIARFTVDQCREVIRLVETGRIVRNPKHLP